MGNKFTKAILKIWKNPFFRIFIYAAILLVLFLISKSTYLDGNIWDYIYSILTKEETLSFFAAGILTIIIALFVKSFEKRLEENLKIESNHHSIIAQYKGHAKDVIANTQNYFSEEGVFMQLHHLQKYHKPIKRKTHNIYNDKVKSLNQEIDLYNKDNILLLPTVNIYTNVLGHNKVVVYDTSKMKDLPDFVIENSNDILHAHKYSNIANNLTIRLNDLKYEDDVLSLYTGRTYYFHMLLTNRCMDYKLDNDLTIRRLYEFAKTITPLTVSKLSNQIGFNGAILTKDGYLLLEKRDRHKTTWKNKFAQPISLALKAEDLNLKGVEEGIDEQKILKVIKKTIKSNFLLEEKDYEILSMDNNFLGVARDLLEGGKPNMYFVVTTNYTAIELANLLKEKASISDETKALSKNKLQSKYYLIKYSDIKIDFNYRLSVLKDKVFKVNRKVYPRCPKIVEFSDNFAYKVSKIFKKHLSYECGEALLVTLSYLEICQDRINAIKED